METKQHTTKADAASEALTGVARTVRADRWMVLAWKFEDGRVVLDHRTTCHFPCGEFGLALMLAAANLLEEKNKLEGANLPTPPPLKVADFPSRTDPPPPDPDTERETMVDAARYRRENLEPSYTREDDLADVAEEMARRPSAEPPACRDEVPSERHERTNDSHD